MPCAWLFLLASRPFNSDSVFASFTWMLSPAMVICPWCWRGITNLQRRCKASIGNRHHFLEQFGGRRDKPINNLVKDRLKIGGLFQLLCAVSAVQGRCRE